MEDNSLETLAIFSPNQNAYSETFIHAHKKLPFNIKYYYGGWFPTNLEASPSLYKFNLIERIKKRFNKKFSLAEHALLQSLRKEKIGCVLAEYAPTACATLKVIESLKLPLVVHFSDHISRIKFEIIEGICPFEIQIRGELREYYWKPKEAIYIEDAEWIIK